MLAYYCVFVVIFFFFKQKTAYEMRISDWSSDVCSSDLVPLLFCGKTTLEDMRTMRQLVDEGLVVPPKYLPEQFRDMNALSAWMCFSNFLNHLSLDRIEADYSNIL